MFIFTNKTVADYLRKEGSCKMWLIQIKKLRSERCTWSNKEALKTSYNLLVLLEYDAIHPGMNVLPKVYTSILPRF